MLNAKEVERLVVEALGEIEGFEIGESLSMEKEEIIDGEIITEEDLKEFQDNVMTHASCFESESYPEEDMIFVSAIEDTKENIMLCLISNETMDKLIKKEIIKY